MRTSECDLVIAGVGGQGVLMISDVIGRAAVLAGKPVCGAETHGMAQRGAASSTTPASDAATRPS